MLPHGICFYPNKLWLADYYWKPLNLVYVIVHACQFITRRGTSNWAAFTVAIIKFSIISSVQRIRHYSGIIRME